jgi:hypothetical protein
MKADRVSIRAVLATSGQDVAKALAENGIFDPVEIPFMYADESFAGGGMIGDGCTPNVTATLELDRTGELDGSDPSGAEPEPSRLSPDWPKDGEQGEAAAPRRTTTLPAAFGIKPLAPVRKPSP